MTATPSPDDQPRRRPSPAMVGAAIARGIDPDAGGVEEQLVLAMADMAVLAKAIIAITDDTQPLGTNDGKPALGLTVDQGETIYRMAYWITQIAERAWEVV